MKKWLRRCWSVVFPDYDDARHPGLKALASVVVMAAVPALIIIEGSSDWSLPDWTTYPIAFIDAIAIMSFIQRVEIWWERGRAARHVRRPIEHGFAGVGFVLWMTATLCGCIALLDRAIEEAHVPSVVLLFFGLIFLVIGGFMAGVPRKSRGHANVILAKKVMNWQLAVSVAIVGPAMAATVGTEKTIMSKYGDDWGLAIMSMVLWLLGAAAGTVLYEPLAHYLKAIDKQTPVRVDRRSHLRVTLPQRR